MKPQILFVDDDPAVLGGLRRVMHRRAAEWDIHLADNAEHAMDLLARQPIDVLVTDMRMPGTDGVALLDHARCRYPATARVVLSGQADRAAILAAAGPTQQFLSKPCDPEHLDDVLSTVVSTVHLMDDPQLRAVMGAQERLPKPPGIYAELTALAEAPGTTARDIARVMEKDMACCAEVLKLVNSSFFGLSGQVATIDRAVALLGLDIISSLVLAGTLFAGGQDLPADLDPQGLSDRALRASLLTRRIATLENLDTGTTDQLALAALLHDVGLLVLAGNDPDAWQEYQRRRSEGGRPERTRAGLPDRVPERELQQAVFGAGVGRATSYLLGLWGFAAGIVADLAAQPLDLADGLTLATASPAELLIAYTHHEHPEALHDRLPSEPGAFLDRDRAVRWAAACSTPLG